MLADHPSVGLASIVCFLRGLMSGLNGFAVERKRACSQAQTNVYDESDAAHIAVAWYALRPFAFVVMLFLAAYCLCVLLCRGTDSFSIYLDC